MRLTKTLFLGEFCCTVAEITLRQYEQIIDLLNAGGAMSPADYRFLALLDSVGMVVFKKKSRDVPFYDAWHSLAADEQNAIFAALDAVNALFISDLTPAPLNNATAQNAEQSRTTLRLGIAALIRHGHPNAWEYGYSFFFECIDELSKANKNT